MPADKKKDEDSTSNSGVFFMAILVALFGMLLGAAYLSSYPSIAFSSEKDLNAFLEGKADRLVKPGDIYYMEASTMRTRGWEKKRELLLSGSPGKVELTHAELNGWLASKFRAPPPASGDDSGSVLISPGVPTLYFNETDIYFNLPAEIVYFGNSRKYNISAKGHLSNSGQVQFDIDSIHFNNAGVPLGNILGDQVMGMLMKAYTSTDEFMEMHGAWARIESIEQGNGVLRIQMR